MPGRASVHYSLPTRGTAGVVRWQGESFPSRRKSWLVRIRSEDMFVMVEPELKEHEQVTYPITLLWGSTTGRGRSEPRAP